MVKWGLYHASVDPSAYLQEKRESRGTRNSAVLPSKVPLLLLWEGGQKTTTFSGFCITNPCPLKAFCAWASLILAIAYLVMPHIGKRPHQLSLQTSCSAGKSVPVPCQPYDKVAVLSMIYSSKVKRNLFVKAIFNLRVQHKVKAPKTVLSYDHRSYLRGVVTAGTCML